MKHKVPLSIIRTNLRRAITIFSTVSLLVILMFFLIRLAGILELSSISSRLTYDLLQFMFPIFLSLLFIITALLFKPVSERDIPAAEPLLITDADSFLYAIPPDEPYLPQIEYVPEDKKPKTQPKPEQEPEAVAAETEPADTTMFDDLESFDDYQSYEFTNDLPSERAPVEKIVVPKKEKSRAPVEEEPVTAAAQPKSAKPVEEKSSVREEQKPSRFNFPSFSARAETKNGAQAEPIEQIEDTLDNRLKQEVEYANENGYDISIAILRFRFKDKNKANAHLPLFEHAIREFLGESAYIYYFKNASLNSYVLILPFASFEETQNELVALYRFMKDAVEEEQLIFSCGFASRFDREIDHEMLMNEAETSLRKALRKRSFSMIGFEPDIDTFNTNI